MPRLSAQTVEFLAWTRGRWPQYRPTHADLYLAAVMG